MASTDKFKKLGSPGTATTLSAPGYTVGATSVTVGSTTNWPTTTGVCFSIYETEVVGGTTQMVAGSYNEYNGDVSTGTSVINVSHVSGSGTDKNYAAGASTIVTIMVSSGRENDLIDGILVQHNQDGTHGAVTATSVTSTGPISGTTIAGTTGTFTGDLQQRSVSLDTFRTDTQFDFIASGCVWSGDAYGSTRNASCTSGVVYLSGKRLTVAAVTARSFTASKDVYCDLHDNGDGTAVWVYTDNTTNAASPALTAGNLRGAIIVVGASNIASATSVNQGQETMVVPIASSVPYAVTDSLGNLICPRDPNRKILGYRQITSNFAPGTSAETLITGLNCPVIIPTNRKVLVTFYSGNIGATTTPVPRIYSGIFGSGGTQIQQMNINANGPAFMPAQYTPSTSSITYTATVASVAGNTTTQASASGPCFLKVELV